MAGMKPVLLNHGKSGTLVQSFIVQTCSLTKLGFEVKLGLLNLVRDVVFHTRILGLRKIHQLEPF